MISDMVHDTLSPAISIVIPAYNRTETISRCVEMVLGQTFSPREVIIVDDCSTDETVKIIRTITGSRIENETDRKD